MAVSNEGKPNRGRLSPRLILALFTLGAGLSATAKLSDPDIWCLLAGGKLVLERAIPSANTFSFTWPDYPWRFTQWLFGVVMRLIELAAGLGVVDHHLVRPQAKRTRL